MILAPLPWERARALRSQGEGLVETGLPGRGGLSAPLECSSCGNGRVSELSLLGTGIWHLIFIQVHSSAFAEDNTGSVPFQVFLLVCTLCCTFTVSSGPPVSCL